MVTKAILSKELPFDVELLPRTIAALRGTAQDKKEHAKYLFSLNTGENAELKSFIDAIQIALFGGNLSELGAGMRGIYKKAWQAIVSGVVHDKS